VSGGAGAGLTAETPARIDLAGGTVDLYPLNAFLGGTWTVNAAIEVRSRVVLAPRPDGAFRIASEDLGERLELPSFEAVLAHPRGSALDLVLEALRFWRPRAGLEVTTRNEAPKGSGLGASSALLVALLGGLRALEGSPHGGDGSTAREVADERLVDWAAAIEAKLLQVPTGKQDYYAALLGGPLAIEFALAGPRPERLAPRAGFLEDLERATLLYFTGEPHFSGAPNWAVLKRYVDGDPGTRRRLERIAAIARAMKGAVEGGDLALVARLLGEEWEERKGLAEGVSTPQLERIIERARAAGAMAAKACGAGGGGCLVVIAPPERRAAVDEAARGEGARPMPLRFAREGLRIERA
jgi:D-glycero-alpha-D-manno-heptose-7-phosphate kinase